MKTLVYLFKHNKCDDRFARIISDALFTKFKVNSKNNYHVYSITFYQGRFISKQSSQ